MQGLVGALGADIRCFDRVAGASGGVTGGAAGVDKRAHSDFSAWLQRTREVTVAGELQRWLLPPMTVGTHRLMISGALEPAYDVGGDVFDYAVFGDVAYLAVLDSMGHDLSSGLAASVAVASWRHHRRRSADLGEVAAAVDADVTGQFDRQRFVTGVFASLDTRRGLLRWTLRGHPAPLVDDGGRMQALRARPDPRMGLGLAASGHVSEQQVEPDARIFFYSDGVTDAGPSRREPFGLEQFTDFLLREQTVGLSGPEALRRLMGALREHCHGRLPDDATVLLAQWRPERGAR